MIKYPRVLEQRLTRLPAKPLLHKDTEYVALLLEVNFQLYLCSFEYLLKRSRRLDLHGAFWISDRSVAIACRSSVCPTYVGPQIEPEQ